MGPSAQERLGQADQSFCASGPEEGSKAAFHTLLAEQHVGIQAPKSFFPGCEMLPLWGWAPGGAPWLQSVPYTREKDEQRKGRWQSEKTGTLNFRVIQMEAQNLRIAELFAR